MSEFPSRVDFELTNVCTLNCVMCPRRYMTRHMGFMETTLALRLIAEIEREHTEDFSHIALHQMGEPCLHPKIVYITEIAAKAGLRVNLTTSALFLTPPLGRALLKAGIQSVSISLDSLDPVAYAAIRKGSDLSEVLSNIDAFLEARAEIDCKTIIDIQTIMMVLTPGQEEAMNARYKERLEAFGGKIYLKKFAVWGGAVSNTIGTLEQSEGDEPCNQMNVSEIVQWNGDVAICCLDFDGKTKVGNAYETSLKELWNGPIFASHRERIMMGDKTMPHCGTCPHLWKPQTEEKGDG